jgi:hypothetical protein
MVDRYHGSKVIKVIDIKNVVKNFGQNILKERDLLEDQQVVKTTILKSPLMNALIILQVPYKARNLL